MADKIICICLLTLLACSSLHAQFSDYNGKIVREIHIQLTDVFEGEDLSWVYRTANALKINTQHEVILRELVFKPGDEITPFLMRESERNLRSLKYLRKVRISTKEVSDTEVDVYVKAQDTWTLIPQASISSGDGREKKSIGLAESNLLGHGERLEFLFIDDDGRETLQTVYDDRRFLGSPHQLILGFFHREDGEKGVISFDKPFRTLVDKHAYGVNFDFGDTAERLFKNGDERFVYREDSIDTGLYYTFALGNPEVQTRRYSFGYGFSESEFEEADQEDFNDLDLSEEDIAKLEDFPLAEDRRFSGPTFAFQSIKPEYASMNYIDRFDRIEDFNLGNQVTAKLQLAPEALGSEENAFLFSSTVGSGYSPTFNSFLRGEIGIASRYHEDGFQNTILRGEGRYYNVLGPKHLGGMYIGKHTLAAAFTFDYAKKLDRDKEFLLGADNFLRGYDARTFSGDKRFILNLEDRIHFIDDLFHLLSFGAAFFVDVGASSFSSLDQMLQDEIYSNVGFGLRLGFPRSSGSRVVRFDLAFPTRNGPDGTDAWDPRFLVSVAQAFDAVLRSEIVQRKNASIETGF